MSASLAGRLRRTVTGLPFAWLPFVIVAFGPVVYLIARSFFPEGGAFSLAPYAAILGSGPGAAARRATLWNSLELAAAVVVVTAVVGVPFGFLIARSNLKFARLYESIAIAPLLLPPYLAGIGWVQLVPMRGLPAIVFILGSSLFPVVALLSARAFREVSADVEDSARQLLGEWRALARVTLPLARGGIVAAALLVFVFAISDFVVPDFFSFAMQGEGTFQVFATEVYGAFVRQLDPMSATAFALPLVAISALALLLLARGEQRRDVASLSGSHVAPRPFRLGRWQPLAHLFLVAVLIVTAAVPLGVLGKMALKRPGARPDATAAVTVNGQPPPPTTVDLSIYDAPSPVGSAVRRYAPDVAHSLRNAGVGVLLLLLLAIGPARALARARRVSTAARAIVLLPLAFPSLLIGMAHQQLFLADSGVIDRIGRGWGLVSLTLCSRFLPVAVLGLAASWRRFAPEIDEAAELAPVGAGTRWLRLRLPLLVPGLVAVGIVVLGLALREFDAIVLLPGAQEMLTSRIYSLVHIARDAVVGALAWMQVLAVFIPWAGLRLLTSGSSR